MQPQSQPLPVVLTALVQDGILRELSFFSIPVGLPIITEDTKQRGAKGSLWEWILRSESPGGGMCYNSPRCTCLTEADNAGDIQGHVFEPAVQVCREVQGKRNCMHHAVM